ncbi:unnamed protein product [Rotaria magnacalcarata]|uniref:G-protein coupled receptors family 1 profile domain-containing protein n=1 Tax=Rotaria magnacalcarata TaxID=392030 RepID=A0A816YR38_9BILA|nr:unnamed protein product [Rotaria magnacalcarata]CAF1600669.1 unnamed protein product [Rotaria magnacalcarata]CAF2170128.1 unnamed protein product [Rotaria magnacalcarata]CAF2225217.1 unnamed protein product [Rotaria magnacalcarata]CAF3984508.1 unnamed protein product [Rotaria magnacalcarata]
MALEYENGSSYANVSIQDYEIGRTIRFWLFLGFDLPSVVCSIFVLYHLLQKQVLRQALHNHSSILMLSFNLVYQLVDIPCHLQYFYTGIIRPATPIFCLIWWFIDWGFFFINVLLLLWAVIERHILFFHTTLIATWQKRLFIHYLPLAMIVLIIMVFYIIAIFVPPCQNTFDYTLDLCGMFPCYETVPFFGTVEQIGFAIIAMSLIAIFSISLLMRVIWQKYQMHRQIQWRKQRRLTLNVICVSLLYLFFCFPVSTIYLVHYYNDPGFAKELEPTLFFLSYFPVFLLPFICLATIPRIWREVKHFDRLQTRRVGIIIVHP